MTLNDSSSVVVPVPRATVTSCSVVPPIDVSGSRTSASFSNAANALYVPLGTPAIWNALATVGASGGDGARSPIGTGPRSSTVSNTETGTSTTLVRLPSPGFTTFTLPASVVSSSTPSATTTRSTVRHYLDVSPGGGPPTPPTR